MRICLFLSFPQKSGTDHRGITEVSQRYHRGITEVSQRYHRGIRGITEVSQRYHRGITRTSYRYELGIPDNCVREHGQLGVYTRIPLRLILGGVRVRDCARDRGRESEIAADAVEVTQHIVLFLRREAVKRRVVRL